MHQHQIQEDDRMLATVVSKVFSPTDTGRGETRTRSVSEVPLPVMLLTTVKFVSTPVVLRVMIQEREKEVPTFRAVLRLRWKVKGEMGPGTTLWAKIVIMITHTTTESSHFTRTGKVTVSRWLVTVPGMV